MDISPGEFEGVEFELDEFLILRTLPKPTRLPGVVFGFLDEEVSDRAEFCVFVVKLPNDPQLPEAEK